MELVEPPVVWGPTPFHGASLAVVDHARALALADELDRVRSCTDLGGLRGVAGTLALAGCPEDLAARAAEPDATPFDWQSSAGFLAGTWPPLPTAETLKCLDDRVIGQIQMTVAECGRVASLRHGIGFRIDEGHGDEVVAAIRDSGPRTITYDRDLLARLSWPEDDPAWG